MKLAIVAAGYVGLANHPLIAQKNGPVALGVDPEKL